MDCRQTLRVLKEERRCIRRAVEGFSYSTCDCTLARRVVFVFIIGKLVSFGWVSLNWILVGEEVPNSQME